MSHHKLQVLLYLETFSTIVSPVNDYYNNKCDCTVDADSAIMPENDKDVLFRRCMIFYFVDV